MSQFLSSDWLLEGPDGLILPDHGLLLCPSKQNKTKYPYSKFFIYQACSIKVADIGLFLSFFAFFSLCYVSVDKNAKNNEANMQPY